jgi:twitching motility protein PilT
MQVYDFEKIALTAVSYKASDIHFETGSSPFYRIDGRVYNTKYTEITDSIVNDIKSIVLQGKDELNRHLEKEGQIDCSYEIKSQSTGEPIVRLRISFSKCYEGNKIVCRLIPIEIPTIEKFNMPDVFKRISEELTGMVIVAGVTGSGKSTTIAAMINHINKNLSTHVITIEDPVEFVHRGKKSIFTHREVGTHTNSFSAGLRAALRMDPDVILVGEMRDIESIRYGILAAETGHLVFSTVHSATVGDVPERIISSFPEKEQSQSRYQIADCGLAYIAQQLIKNKSGKGRSAAYEILILNSAARNLIRTNKSFQLDSVIQTEFNNGCITMTRSLINLYDSGYISEEDLIKHSPSKTEARDYIIQHTDGKIDVEQPSFWNKFI